jgi:ferredoxin
VAGIVQKKIWRERYTMFKKNKWRWIISIFFLILIPVLGILHQVKGGGPSGSPSTDALCPFGGLETIYSLITRGEYINRIEPSSLILLISDIALAILFGRVFCGLICPLGTMQTLMNKLAGLLHIKQIKVSGKLDRILRYVKYPVLVIVLFLTFRAGELIIRSYDPWAAFMHLSAGTEVFNDFLAGVIILAAILILSLFIERAWCRYLCPLGAALAIISPLRIFKFRKNSISCKNCRSCTRNCPMGLQIDNTEAPSQTECISCGECVSRCPVDNTLQLKKKNIIISPGRLAAITIAVVVIIAGIAIASGSFKTASSNTEALMEEGRLNPDNIKGYMTLNDVISEFKVSPDELLDMLKLPGDTDLNKPLKDLSKELPDKGLEFETDDVREAIRELIK